MVDDTIKKSGIRFVIIWTVSLLLFYLVAGYFGTARLRSYQAETTTIREAKIESLSRDLATQGADPLLPSGAKPLDVQVGLVMNRIGDFALKESVWTADFNIFFHWSGEAVNPGENFRIVNGQIMQQEKVDEYRNNGENFAEYHVVARVTKPFDASRFPFAVEGLVVEVEDTSHDLRYLADKDDSNIRPEAVPRGLKLDRFLAGSITKNILPGRGKAEISGKTEIRSQIIVGMLVVPDSFGIYLKLFQALLASVAVALIALCIKPIHVDCRFGLPVGGFFAAVGNNIFVASMLPQSDRLTLADMVNTTGLVTIFLILVQSAISLYMEDTLGQVRLRRIFDNVSFAIFLFGYLAVNLALPLSAMG